MRAFSDETNICMGNWIKQMALPSVGVGLVQLTESWYQTQGASLIAQMVKNLPARQKSQVQSLDWEDPLEKEMTTHYSNLA